MPDPVWYRSLYWRIALGFVALLATLLVVQGLIFLWMTGRMQEILWSRSAATFATEIATDVELVISEKTKTDLDTFLNERYASSYRAFAVVTQDGTTVVGRSMPGPPNMARAARDRLFGEGPGDRRGGRGRGGGPPGPPDGFRTAPPPPPDGPPPDQPPPDGDPRGRDDGRGGGAVAGAASAAGRCSPSLRRL